MPETIKDFVNAGAIPALINHHANMGGRDSDWIQTEVFAYREFRTADPRIVQALVRMAKAAKIAADLQNCLKDGECLDSRIIPGM